MNETEISERKPKPHGRDEVMRAVLESAVILFSEKSFSEVSIRDIAEKAGINHGLIHRHFGTKEELRRQAQNLLDRKLRQGVGSPESFQDALMQSAMMAKKDSNLWKMLARFLLDEKLNRNPSKNYIQDLVELFEADQKKGILSSEIDPRYGVCGLLAMGLGLELFHTFLFPSVGLEDGDKEEFELYRSWMNYLIPESASSIRD